MSKNQRKKKLPGGASGPSSGTAGRRLSAARQGWGVGIEEVAQNLNLGIKTIEALEQDAHERLPGSTYTRGYLRSYAKLLNLDPDEIVSLVNWDAEADESRKIPNARTPLRIATQGSRRSHLRHSKRGGWWLPGLLIVVVLVGLAAVAVSRLPGSGMDKIRETLGLSQPAGVAETSYETLSPAASSIDTGAEGDEPQE